MFTVWLLIWICLFLLQRLITVKKRDYILIYLILIAIVVWNLYHISYDKLFLKHGLRSLFVKDIIFPLYMEEEYRINFIFPDLLPKLEHNLISLVESDIELVNTLKSLNNVLAPISPSFMREIAWIVVSFMVVYVESMCKSKMFLIKNLHDKLKILYEIKHRDNNELELVENEIDTIIGRLETYMYALENRLVKKNKIFDMSNCHVYDNII